MSLLHVKPLGRLLLLALLATPAASLWAQQPAPPVTASAVCRCTCGALAVEFAATTRENCQQSNGSSCANSQLSGCDLHFEIAVAQGLRPGFLCADDQTWQQCIGATVGQPKVTVVATGKEIESAVKEAVSNTLTAASSLSGASAKKSFLPQFQLATGLADFLDEDGMLLFSYNTPAWQWGRLKIEARPSRPEIFDKLAAVIPEDQRAVQSAAINRRLGQFDRVTYSAKLNFLSANPDAVLMGSDDPSIFAKALIHQENGQLLDKRAQASLDSATMASFDLLRAGLVGPIPPITSNTRTMGETLIRQAIEARDKADNDYFRYLNQIGFFRLADLLDNQPQLYLTGELQRQDELAGPRSSFQGGLVWEHGFGPNYRKLRAFLGNCQAEGAADAAPFCFQEYFRQDEVKNDRKWRLALKAEYGQTKEYDSPLEGIDLHLDEAQSWIASFTIGGVLKFQERPVALAATPEDAPKIEQTRFDFEAKYEDVSGDALRQDRLNLTLTVSQRVNDDFSVEVSAVWASRPEYLGEVDQQLGALAGLRYKINRNE